MLDTDRDAVLCDLAQCYGIFDIHSVPAATVARLAAGLPPESRIMRHFRKQEQLPLDTLLLAAIADRLGILAWMQTKDGMKGRRQPQSILQGILRQEERQQTVVFSSPEEFEAARERIMQIHRKKQLSTGAEAPDNQ